MQSSIKYITETLKDVQSMNSTMFTTLVVEAADEQQAKHQLHGQIYTLLLTLHLVGKLPLQEIQKKDRANKCNGNFHGMSSDML